MARPLALLRSTLLIGGPREQPSTSSPCSSQAATALLCRTGKSGCTDCPLKPKLLPKRAVAKILRAVHQAARIKRDRSSAYARSSDSATDAKRSRCGSPIRKPWPLRAHTAGATVGRTRRVPLRRHRAWQERIAGGRAHHACVRLKPHRQICRFSMMPASDVQRLLNSPATRLQDDHTPRRRQWLIVFGECQSTTIRRLHGLCCLPWCSTIAVRSQTRSAFAAPARIGHDAHETDAVTPDRQGWQAGRSGSPVHIGDHQLARHSVTRLTN